MKQSNNNKLLIAVAIFWMFVPVQPGNSQSQTQKDSIILRVNAFGQRVEAVSQKADLIESKLLSYPEKIQTFDSLLSLVPKQKTIVRVKKIASAKERLPDKYQSPVSETEDDYYAEEQYVDRPVIVYRTCDITYGGDTFRTNMWKAPGEDGLIKQIFKRKRK